MEFYLRLWLVCSILIMIGSLLDEDLKARLYKIDIIVSSFVLGFVPVLNVILAIGGIMMTVDKLNK